LCDNTDSLKAILNSSLTVKEKVDILNSIAEEYLLFNADSSLTQANLAFQLSDQIRYFDGKGKALYIIGEYYTMKGDFDQARKFYQSSRAQYSLAGNNVGVGNALVSLARSSNWLGKYDEAIQLAYLAIQNFQTENNKTGIAKAFNTMGISYDRNEQKEKAKLYYNHSFTLFRQENDKQGMANVLINMAIIYGKEGNLEESLSLFNQSLELSREIKNNRILTSILNNTGIIHKTKGDFGKAEKSFLESMQINLSSDNQRSLLFSYLNLASLYIQTNHLEKALYYQNKATKLAIKFDALPELAECYNNYCTIYEKLGQYQKALEYHRKYKETDDRLQSEKILQNMQLTEEKFQLEFKQNELELQKKDNEILTLKLNQSTWLKNFLIGLLISVISLLILFIFHYRSKMQTNTYLSKLNAELSETNQKLINSEIKLRELNATKDKFFSIISHDLRNPFASLVSFVRIMQRDYDNMNDQEIRELVADMKTTVEKAQDLLENLLVWSKTQTGKVIFHPEEFNLFEAVQENVHLYQSTLNHKQIAVQLFIGNPTSVFGDFNMIKTIIRNLLSNSIKFTNQKGNIIISYEKNHTYHILRIRDNGMGLKEEAIPLLFVPGGQKSRYGTANEKGSGIGLLICKEFIDRHNGYIHVESTVNEGSTFSIHFPVITDQV